MGIDPPSETTAVPPKEARVRTLAALLVCFAGFGCVIRDPGHDRHPSGSVQAEALCSEQDDGDGCPACSQADGQVCRDRFYRYAYRCRRAGDGTCEPLGGRCVDERCVVTDSDRDGLDDDLAFEIAQRNLPALALDRGEACSAPRALLFRVRRHPEISRRLAITYVVLYRDDCGSFGHLGDNEAFAITVDLDAAPGPAATVGVATQAHRGTLCESVSTCSAAPGTSACASRLTEGEARIVVYVSRDKHANYLDTETCGQNCLDVCSDGQWAEPRLLADVGQPDAPLSYDLTAEGVITLGEGWPADLLHFAPWGEVSFGFAGRPRDQLLTLIAPSGW